MNSNTRRVEDSLKGSVFPTNYEFDFGMGPGFSNRQAPRSLKDQKQHNNAAANSFSSPKVFSSSSSKPASSWAPNKPAWTHQPANPPPRSQQIASGSNPTSMVGDILGKSWVSTNPSSQGSRLGIGESNPILFGDLVGNALGQGKSNANVPLKDAPPKNSFRMGSIAESIPKPNPLRSSSWGSDESLGSFSTQRVNKNANFSGSAQTGVSAMKDPFGSFVDFGKKPAPTSQKTNAPSGTNSDYPFGAFQIASKSGSAFASMSNSTSIPKPSSSDPFSGLSFNQTSHKPTDMFGFPTQDFTSQKSTQQTKGSDPVGMFFASSSSAAVAEASASQPFSGVDDWGLDSEFGGDDTSTTTELEGLPPPPSGVTASSAKSKGLDNQKQGQYADAIKWLSWAVILFEKTGDYASTMEVLTCRASCYKEVGEYKKAVADCSKALDHDSGNISVLLQRALLYESTEKYKLGAEDLRTVLKIDPGNRLAKNTLHRLAKLAD